MKKIKVLFLRSIQMLMVMVLLVGCADEAQGVDGVITTNEVLELFSQLKQIDIDELTCRTVRDGERYELSWENPGGGTGGGWFIDPFNGDVYSAIDNTLLFNLYDEK